jgi:hypothetical protein
MRSAFASPCLVALALALLSREVAAEEPAPDASKDGPLAVARMDVEVPDALGEATLSAVLFHPSLEPVEGSPPPSPGPWPAIVFSPGGPAQSVGGYDDFASRFASLGVVTLVVAFGDHPAEERAKQFAKARTWLEAKSKEEGWPLKGKIDLKTVLAGGHSRGAAAAILAAADAKSWVGCVAVGPALNALPAKYATPTFLIGSTADEPAMAALYRGLKKPRAHLLVASIDHYLRPPELRPEVVTLAAGWLLQQITRKPAWKTWLAQRVKADLESKVLSTAEIES